MMTNLMLRYRAGFGNEREDAFDRRAWMYSGVVIDIPSTSA